MKKTLLLSFFCMVLIVICNTPQIFAKDKTAKNDQSWAPWISLDSYKIGSGDILRVITWKEPDLSREQVLVRTDGKITFPLLDDVQAAGLTPLELKKNIQKKLEGFVDGPVVTVTVQSPASQKFYILGEVVRTGEYKLLKSLTVLQAFALAGGFTKWASKKEIILLRRENGKEKIIRINYKNITTGKDFSQNVRIKANDTIIVP